jgi:putative intracellular protease/amidase
MFSGLVVLMFAAGIGSLPAWSATLPTVVVAATDNSAAETSRDTAVFTVTRSGAPLTQPLTVVYSLTGSATNGTDYDRLTGSVSIPAGHGSAKVVVRPVDDAVGEANESVILTLKTSTLYALGSAKSASATIIDNDTIVQVSAPDPSAAEAGRDPAVFTVMRTGGPTTQPLTVAYTMSGTATNGSDYTALPGSVTIAAGQTSASITLVPVDDSVADPNETAVLTLSARSNYRIGATGSATARITDNDRATLLPVLMVIANVDFYYREYSETRASLVQAGIPVTVAAAQRVQSYPHANSGQGADGGVVMPDIDLASADASKYSAIVFVGGWGASSYQYAFSGTYSNGNYNGSAATRAKASQLVNDFTSQGKYVTAICHGVSVLAWARVNGQSPLKGRRVAGYHGAAPQSSISGSTTSEWHIQQNGGSMFPSGSLGVPSTVSDDVWVDGKIITAENYDTAARFGQVIAQQLLK